MNFSGALERLKEGAIMKRRNWENIQIYVAKKTGNIFISKDGIELNCCQYCDASLNDKDILANDWEIVE